MIRALGIVLGLVLSAAAAQAQTLRQLHSFDAATEGTSTSAPLIQARDGSFYGVNRADGPHGHGTVFRMMANGTLLVLHAFTGGADGGRPGGELVEGRDGHLYGTTAEGGLFNGGVAFRITLDGTLTVLYAFGATAGAGRAPGALIQVASGEFYGTTCAGGANGAGTVFRMTEAGNVTPLYDFSNGADGRCPNSLLMARDGLLYGTASGGALGDGLAFRLTPDGTFTNIHDYVRGMEGGRPGPLLQSRIDGLFYGVAMATRGPFDFTYGSVYRMTPAGVLQVMHMFGGGPNDGIYPIGRLVEGTDGNFYGVTEHGGLPWSYFTSTGTIYRLTRDGTHTVLRLFRGEPDGMNPQIGLLQSSDGHLYGSATGGFGGHGMIFRLDTYLCTNTVGASYSPEFQSLHLSFSFQSAAAGTWSVWGITSAGVIPLWSVPVGPVSLPTGISSGYNVAPLGPVLFVTRLEVPGFGSCGGIAFVDTGTAAVPLTRK
jgi:uncharacterized repeat protein (TIGR03803 family)